MTKILKRKLYVGFGGSGTNAILKIKENILAQYGEIPAHIKFLAIDVDPSLLHSVRELKLLKSEYVYLNLKCFNEQIKKTSFYTNKELMCYITPSAKSSAKLIAQCKPFGRFAYWLNQIDVEKIVKKNLISLMPSKAFKNSNYKVSESLPEVDMVFSSGGGLGAGIYLDLAWFIRRISPNIKINASIILGSVFRQFPCVNRVLGNTYATLLELEHMQNSNLNSTFSAHYLNTTKPIFFKEGKLFDTIRIFEDVLKNGNLLDLDAIIESVSEILTSKESEKEYAKRYDSHLFKSLLEGSVYKRSFKQGAPVYFIDSYFEQNISNIPNNEN
tara:strand:- start:186 stop:1172 length:987 start_codon:yes stop_codon:yes gene_type:complete